MSIGRWNQTILMFRRYSTCFTPKTIYVNVLHLALTFNPMHLLHNVLIPVFTETQLICPGLCKNAEGSLRQQKLQILKSRMRSLEGKSTPNRLTQDPLWGDNSCYSFQLSVAYINNRIREQNVLWKQIIMHFRCTSVQCVLISTRRLYNKGGGGALFKCIHKWSSSLTKISTPKIHRL